MSRRTDVVVYSPVDAMKREFEERVRAKLENMALLPTHYRSSFDILAGRNNTWDDHVATYDGDAKLSRAKGRALLGRRDVALVLLEVAELPLQAEREAEARARRHDEGMLRLDYQCELLKTAIAEEQHKRRLMKARTDEELRRLGVRIGHSNGFDPEVAASASPRVRKFKTSLAEKQQLRDERDKQIAEIRRSGLPQEEQDRRIQAVIDATDEILNEGGAS